jgi:hypothetical protein
MKQLAIGMLIIATGSVFGLLVRLYPDVTDRP